MDNLIDKSFLGTGWSFPPAFDFGNRSVRMVSEEEDIQQSLFILFSTTPGERLMNQNYGCDLQGLVFERISNWLHEEIKSRISMAVLLYEPRIEIEEIRTEVSAQEDGRIDVLLEYRIRTTNARNNIVYPFYLKEGTNLRF